MHVLVVGHLLRIHLLLHLLILFLRVIAVLLVTCRCVLLRCQHVHSWRAQEDWAQMTHILGLSVDVLRDAEHDAVSHDLVLLAAMWHHDVLVTGLLALSELVVRRRCCLVHHSVRSQDMVH